jgi:hypothetical protein
MIKITSKQYNGIHRDYRGTWTNEDHPALIGKKIAFEISLQSAAGVKLTGHVGSLAFEGIDFEIVEA